MRYDAVVFDLLTALLDSWTLWNAVAGSEEAGMRWRRRYLEITYGCGAYRPYETLVRDAAVDVGLPAELGGALERRWRELQPWPEAPAVLKTLPLPLAVATNCSVRLGRQAAERVGAPFAVVETAESVGFYKPRPEVYRAVLLLRSGHCSSPARPQMCRGRRLSACRSTGTIASGFRRVTTRGPTISNRRSMRWAGCVLRAKLLLHASVIPTGADRSETNGRDPFVNFCRHKQVPGLRRPLGGFARDDE